MHFDRQVLRIQRSSATIADMPLRYINVQNCPYFANSQHILTTLTNDATSIMYNERNGASSASRPLTQQFT